MSYLIQKGKTEFLLGFSNPEQLAIWLEQNQGIIGLAFVGRSNSGKSTLINSLFGKDVARTSNTPGRTQQINVFKFKLSQDGKETAPEYFLFDLPGYGFSKVSKATKKNWDFLMTYFFSRLPPALTLITLQDARHPNQKIDKEFISFLRMYSLKTILCLNKMDKLKTQSEKINIRKISLDLKKFTQIHFISAEKKTGLDALEQALVSAVCKWT